MIENKMKAVAICGEGDVKVIELEIPQPKPGEVLIKMQAAAICTVDQRFYNGVVKGKFPMIAGHEGVGIVEKVGECVHGLKEGDIVVPGRQGCGVCKNCKTKGINCLDPTGRVNFDFHPETRIYGDIGCMSEYMVKQAAHVVKIQGGDPVELALTEPVSCVLRSVERSRLNWTETAVVVGAGIMGLLHVQLAKLKGARVIVSEVDAKRRQKALELGADYVINPMETDPGEFVHSVTEGGADVVFNTVAISKVFAQAFDMIGVMGRIVAYSNQHPDIPVPIEIGKLHKKQYEIIGTNGSSVQDFYYAAKLIESGSLKLGALVDSVYSKEECGKAFERACKPDSYRCVFDFTK